VKLGPYEVIAPVGAGGMGEVYRARDTRLGRDVAVKVLPAEFTQSPDRLRRFAQEARAVAALNHPNILTVHDVGAHDGTSFVVTELLEGETLREVLSRRLPTQRQRLALAVQAAHGLAAAHRVSFVPDLLAGVTGERDLLFPDRLHPNAAGYARFAEALRPIFAKLELGKTTAQ